ncbi:NAD-binding protein [Candidatus Uhrbacteria bacterium]|nr:NAD-binding protein [Candidatus Uhrbacteria bacterium]
MGSPILIIGSSHLAFRVGKKLHARNVAFAHIPSERFVEHTLEKSDLEHVKEVLAAHGIANARAVCILDDADAQNINLLLAALAVDERVPLYVAITNENLVAHIAASHTSVHVFNPYAIAATTFVDAVHGETHAHPTAPPTPPRQRHPVGLHTDRIIRRIIVLLVGIIAVGALFFRWSEGASWSQSVYLIATIVSGNNFEDAVVQNYSMAMVIARTIMILSVQIAILIAFSLVVDRIIKRRTEILAFGRKRYSLKDHIIVCGLGRAGFHITMELLRHGEKVLVIEPNDDSRFLSIVRAAGAHVLIGDATLANNLANADLAHAAALVSTVSNDLRNLEIGLNARSLRKDIRLILRIFDREIAEEMKTRFHVHFAFSTSSVAAQHLVGLLAPNPA